jgi:hypothetical protein
VLPLSGNPLREINSFVFTSSNRNLIVDTGMKRDEYTQRAREGLSGRGSSLRRKIEGVMVAGPDFLLPITGTLGGFELVDARLGGLHRCFATAFYNHALPS